MRRTLLMPASFLIAFALLATTVFSAEPARPSRSDKSLWGIVTKASAESVTIEPEVASRGKEKPAERTFALSKDVTQFGFAEVGFVQRMSNGTTLRTLNDPQPAVVDDLEVGQFVQVTPGDAAAAPAKLIIIVWSVPGAIVKVNADSITFRPEPAPSAPKRDDLAANDKELKISKDDTIVSIVAITDERPTPDNRGVQQTISDRDGTLADLKADQSVVVCIRGGTAAKIKIHAKELTKRQEKPAK